MRKFRPPADATAGSCVWPGGETGGPKGRP